MCADSVEKRHLPAMMIGRFYIEKLVEGIQHGCCAFWREVHLCGCSDFFKSTMNIANLIGAGLYEPEEETRCSAPWRLHVYQ